jgi:hypothetical protein
MNIKLLLKSLLRLKTINKNLFFVLILLVSGITFGQNHDDVIKNYLSTNLEKYNLLKSDIDEWKITSEVYSKQAKVTHIYIQQLYKGIPVFNAVSNISIRESDNKVIFLGTSFVKNLAAKINSVTPALKPKTAIIQVASALQLGSPNGIELMKEKGVNNYIFSKSGISQENIPVELVYQPLKDGSVKLSWLLNVYQLDGIHWWNVRVDANTGVILQKNDWGVNCDFDIETGIHSHGSDIQKESNQSPLITIKKNENIFEGDQYNVFALPVESPNHGGRSILSAPHNLIASPFGWHDTDGVLGAEYTITRGNNVYAQLDDDKDNGTFGYSPDGGSDLNFNFTLDLDGKSPDSYKDVSITNLFYVNNVMHDIWYQYGFDEGAGNFQAKNYVENDFPFPLGEDEVIADAQDGSGKNNANFSTPPEGLNPRMQMYLWDNPSMKINTGSLIGKYVANDARFTADGTANGIKSGAPLKDNPVTADIALMNDTGASPINGCSDSGLPIAGLDGKIVIIGAGGCTFVSKVQLAQDNNAVGVIIVNNGGGNLIMGGQTTTIRIPSVSVSKEIGDAIITALLNFETINATLSAIDIDGSLDNGIIAHEYGHGISNRLIGGPLNVNCMQNQEQLGEGWSDYFGLAITMKPGDTKTTVRGVGTFTRSEPITGTGIRRYPYTTDMSVNPFSFRDVQNQALSDGAVSVHGVGSIWATMLWDLNWKMIGAYGFDSDMYTGTGGNNKTMSLVIEGLKLTPCGSGFIGARDAILAADELLNAGVNKCIIWEVFARRGLGFSASSGEADSFKDQIETFDMPPASLLTGCASLNLNKEVLKVFRVYPNPASTSINISITTEVKNATISIYDINGRQVYSKKSDLKGTVNINTGTLSAGIYILKINNEEINYSQKLIIN